MREQRKSGSKRGVYRDGNTRQDMHLHMDVQGTSRTSTDSNGLLRVIARFFPSLFLLSMKNDCVIDGVYI